MCEIRRRSSEQHIYNIHHAVYAQLFKAYNKLRFAKLPCTYDFLQKNVNKFWCKTNSFLKAIKRTFSLSETKYSFLTN